MKLKVLAICILLSCSFFALAHVNKNDLSLCPGLKVKDQVHYHKIFDTGLLAQIARDKIIEKESTIVLNDYQSDCSSQEHVHRAKTLIQSLLKHSYKLELKRAEKEFKRVSEFKLPNNEWEHIVKLSEVLNISPYSSISLKEKETHFSDALK